MITILSPFLASKFTGEPFWENSAADYFSGLALGLFMDAEEEEVNMNSINYFGALMVPDAKM